MARFGGEEATNGAPDGRLDEGVAGPYDEMIPALNDVPRPRRVRMSRKGKSTAVLVSVILFVSMSIFVAGISAKSAAAVQNGAAPQTLIYALPILFILVFVPLMLGTIARQKTLLVNGEIGLGKVTGRRLARHGPVIRYEFTTSIGEHFSRKGSDGTGQLSVGMRVPIFYDERNSKKQLALCASFYEVILPGME